MFSISSIPVFASPADDAVKKTREPMYLLYDDLKHNLQPHIIPAIEEMMPLEVTVELTIVRIVHLVRSPHNISR